MFYYFARFLCAVFCVLFFRIRIYGRENVPKKGAFILAGNHVSYLDPVVFGVSCPRVISYMARSTLFNNKIFGWIITHCHTFPVKREGGDIGAFREALRRLKKGVGLLVFPEGTRSLTGELGKARAGIGLLIKKSGVPVLPAYADGSKNAWPKGAKFPRPVRITVHFGKLIDFNMNQELSDQEVAEKVMDQIRRIKESLKT
ncbi:MAG TPA: lysophospholipid acyltransferase family protein [Candidatus Omnitrophota bacterium]|nr:lysophospholipid acyltransferase family protein [Candidatus Omnitrophota bacterium]